MTKLTKAKFLSKLDYATCQARLNREGVLLSGYQVRDAIDRVGLPLPAFKELGKADAELCDNPIFRAVNELSNVNKLESEFLMARISMFYPLALVEAAWEHYESVYRSDHLVRGGLRYS